MQLKYITRGVLKTSVGMIVIETVSMATDLIEYKPKNSFFLFCEKTAQWIFILNCTHISESVIFSMT